MVTRFFKTDRIFFKNFYDNENVNSKFSFNTSLSVTSACLSYILIPKTTKKDQLNLSLNHTLFPSN